MAALSESDRAEIWAQFMRDNKDPLDLTKPELRAMFNAVDDWIDTNAPAFVAALPVAAQAGTTGKQKARVFFAVALRRFEVT